MRRLCRRGARHASVPGLRACRAGTGGRTLPGLRPWALDRAPKAALNAELLDRPWLRALFIEFGAWEGLRRTAATLPRRFGTYGCCFAAIGEGCASPAEIGQERLTALLGAEGLRRQHLVVRFLAGRLGFDWNPGRVEVYIEHGRVGALLAASDAHPCGPVLRAYRDHLAQDPTLRPKTVRSYLKGASGSVGYSRRPRSMVRSGHRSSWYPRLINDGRNGAAQTAAA